MNIAAPFPLPSVIRIRRVILALLLLAFQMALTLAQAKTQTYAWGNNNAGQCSIPASLTNAQVVAGGYEHSLAIRSDGTVMAWGFNNFGQTNVPGNLTNVVAVAGGEYYSLALQSNGTVVLWGNQTAVPAGLTNATAIAGGWLHCLALRSNGTVVAWGGTSVAATNVPLGLTNVVAIAAGSNLSLALKANGSVVAWGDNTYGQTNVPSQLTNVVAISAGEAHALALNRDGSIVAWGADFAGQTTIPPDVTNAVAIGAGALHSMVLKMDGTLEAWGDNTYNQTNVGSSLTGYFAIGVGAYHDLAVLANGSPTIFVQPENQAGWYTKSIDFQVLASGAPPLGYQWQFAGKPITGATNSSLLLNDLQFTNAGLYAVVVSNMDGTVTSSNAALTVTGEPPFFLSQPEATNYACGDNAVIAAAADGSSPLIYQWQVQGQPVPGATNSNLTLNDVFTNQAGNYRLIVTNQFGAVTSMVATLSVEVVPPVITSTLETNAEEGQPFSYTITALYTPITFGASGLPEGLAVDPTTGIISGVPQENGTFGVDISAVNECTYNSEILILNISSGVPVITNALTANGAEEQPFSFQITATQSPTSFGGEGLPPGLSVNRNTGRISGLPTYSGVFYSTIYASNSYGAGTATLQINISDEQISGLSIGSNIVGRYTSPYLLNYQFTLLDNNDPTVGNAIVANPSLMVVTNMENGIQVFPPEYILRRGSIQPIKVFLVLDFAETMASLDNGQSNGVSDALLAEVNGAESFVSQQPLTSLVGVYQFNRDDQPPLEVVPLTNNTAYAANAIGQIWSNDQEFASGATLWDAVGAAITALGPANTNEQHYVIVASDGVDESSATATLQSVVTEATNSVVTVYCIGLGDDLSEGSNNLQQLASQTSGRYFQAGNLNQVPGDFNLVSKDINGQYILRWATLERSSQSFQPSFSVTYQGMTALTPSNPPVITNMTFMTNSGVVTTNTTYVTNDIIWPYTPTVYAGGVTTGLLSLATSLISPPTSLVLSAYYMPRNIEEMHLHYRANWPCTVSLLSTNVGDMLNGWTMSQASDGTNGFWLTLNCPNPPSVANSIAFASFGDILQFSFQDQLFGTNSALSFLAVDNTIYTNTGGQFLLITNLASFATNYPALPFGTPVPWLIHYGYPYTGQTNYYLNELADPDNDGMRNWQEYRANTDPTNAASKLYINGLSLSPDGVRYQVSFTTSQDRTYRVLSSTNLLDWQTVQENIAGVGTPATNVVVTTIDTSYYGTSAAVFYRVEAY